MKKKLIIGMTAAAITLGGLGATWASSRDGGEKPGGRLSYLAEELELTADQKQQIADVMKSRHDAQREGRDDHREFRQKLLGLNPAAPDYQKQLDELVRQAQQQAREMVLQRADQQQKLHEILTPEQRSEFAELKQKMHKKGYGHHGEHGKHRKGKDCD